MAIYETFSQRQQRAANEGRAVLYQYDTLPKPFRVQVMKILQRSLGSPSGIPELATDSAWTLLHDTISEAIGVICLGSTILPPDRRCLEFLLGDRTSTAHALDLIELAFRLIEPMQEQMVQPLRGEHGVTATAEEAIYDLNHRFREHGIGYQFVGGQLVRVDSQYIHAEAVEPAVRLLYEESFKGASDEFMAAHRHYRQGDYKAAMTEAAKALESTLKTICDARAWPYDPNKAGASDLLKVAFDKGLVPSFVQAQFAALQSVLASGAPTLRNKRGAHGQGAAPVEAPEHLAAYALHSAASAIVFLVESHKALKTGQ